MSTIKRSVLVGNVNWDLNQDIEGVFVKVNLRKTKWLIFGVYRPLCQSVEYLFKNVGFALDTLRQTHEKFLLARDFNTEEIEPFLSEFSTNYDCSNLVKDKTCFKNPENPTCIYLFITNSIMSYPIFTK